LATGFRNSQLIDLYRQVGSLRRRSFVHGAS
jgi:hypothetical protein